MESSTPNNPNKDFILETETDLAGSAATVKFYYHMYGSTMGTLSFDTSSDSGATWTTLRRHDDDQTMERRGFVVAHWAVEGVTASFRHFRVHQHGPTADGTNIMYCNGIELYGTLTEA